MDYDGFSKEGHVSFISSSFSYILVRHKVQIAS